MVTPLDVKATLFGRKGHPVWTQRPSCAVIFDDEGLGWRALEQ